MKITQIKKNPNNPRVIRDDKFRKLCKSITDFPEMMEKRPIVIDEDNMILGGNQRFAALKALGYKDIPNEWISAATPAERMEALKILNKKGIKTWVSLEPVIVPEQALNLLTQVAPYVDHVKIGKLNNYKGIDKDVDWSRFLEDAVTLCRKLDLKFYIKERKTHRSLACGM